MFNSDFSNIKVGDTVAVRTRHGRTLHSVIKVTATQFVVETGTRFMRHGGREYGITDRWCSRWASIPTDDDIAAIKAEHRQYQAISSLRKLENEIQSARIEIDCDKDKKGWAASLELANRHMRCALEALSTKQEVKR
jgi:hypothetical protein